MHSFDKPFAQKEENHSYGDCIKKPQLDIF